MWKSCASVFLNTHAWEQQECNKTETHEEGKDRRVSIERSKAGTKGKTSPAAYL